MPPLSRTAPVALLVLLALSSTAFAQGGLGVKAGLSQSTLATTPDAPGTAWRSDFSAGGFLVVRSRAPVTGQFEALITRRGAAITGGSGFISLGEIRSTYLDVSAFLRTLSGGDGLTRVYFYGGPTIGFELKSELLRKGVTTDFDIATEDWDVILAAGGGVEIGRFVFEGRYNHGLSNLLVGASLFGFQAKHRSVLLLSGFRF